MAIDILRFRGRRGVAWLSSEPPQEARQVFSERDYKVVSCTDDQLESPAFIEGLAAVVFTQDALKLPKMQRDLKRHARRLLDYDCRVIVLSAPSQNPSILTDVLNAMRLPVAGIDKSEAKKLESWQPAGQGDPPLPHIHCFSGEAGWANVANFVIEHPPSEAPKTALTIGGEAHVRPNHRILLQRAFADCAAVDLAYMPETGRSGVSVYRAHATVKGDGSWSLPYFVKIGNREKILREFKNYIYEVGPEVPFHLGPQLALDRCCLGAHEGVIVGDYVDESESLLSCAREGRAAPVIACLFDRTLQGWHRGAVLDPRALTTMLRVPKDMPPDRIARAHSLGAKKSLAQLRGLFEQGSSAPVRTGTIHGDLHAANVRVRGTDAVVIDFYAARLGHPLVCDAACLEASLLVEGFAHDKRSIGIWLKSIKPLFENVRLDEPGAQVPPLDQSAWFFACIRQIRLYARRMENGTGQYAVALAIALLRKASKDRRVQEPEASRRAAALVLAERVLLTSPLREGAKANETTAAS
jgi:hypothetical protein